MKLLKTNILFLTALTALLVYVIGCEKPSTGEEQKVESTKEAHHESQAKAEPASNTKTDSKAGSKSEPRVLPNSLSSVDNSKKDAQAKPQQDKSDKPNLATGVNLSSGISSKDSKQDNTIQLVEQVVTVTPTTLDLGSFSTSEKGTGSVTLTNTGDKPVTLERAKASCGCTTSDFQNGTVLQPGEATDVSVTMNGKGRARKMSKTVTFTIKDYPPIRLPVVAETVSYVTIDKDPITIEDDYGMETITLTAIDEQPFVVTSILPAIAEELSTEPATSHEIKLDWKAFWDVVQTTKVTVRLDHPLCNEITTNIRLSAEQRQRLNEIIKLRREGGELPSKDPTRPQTGDQLARYIKAGRGEQVLKYIQDGLGQYNAVDRGGVALLSIAAEAGDANTVDGLIEFGAEIERVDRVNRTPLMYAARSKNPETIQLLLDKGADIQARDRLGNTPLSWAAGFGSAGGVQVLVDAGADANTVDTVLGYTPLVWASGFGDTDSIVILLEAGADVSVNDIAEGRTPLMHAVRTGELAGVISLLEAGAKVNGIDNSKSTALHIGADNGNVSLDKIQVLVEAGADLNATNREGKTALDLAKMRTDDDGKAIAEYLSSKTTSE